MLVHVHSREGRHRYELTSDPALIAEQGGRMKRRVSCKRGGLAGAGSPPNRDRR